MKRDYSLIDPKVHPLVDALNGIAGVQTGLSSAGQIWPRRITPFVYVTCTFAIAKMIDGKLREIHKAGRLNYWWAIDGHFLADETMEFRVRSRKFGFLEFLAGRQKINQDLLVLANEFRNSGHDSDGLRQVILHQVSAEQQTRDDQNSGQSGLLAKRIIRLATGALLGAGSQGATTDLTFKQLIHGYLDRLGVCVNAWNIARAFLAVVFLTTTLAACGSNREIQKDGSGTDEMLKSPCVCVPVDYQAPTYKWVS